LILVASASAAGAALAAASFSRELVDASWIITLVCVFALLWGYQRNSALGWIHSAAAASAGLLTLGFLAGWAGSGPPLIAEVSAVVIAVTATALGLSARPYLRRVEHALANHANRTGDGWLVADRRGVVVAANPIATRVLVPALARADESISGKTVPRALLRAFQDASGDPVRLHLGGNRFFEVRVSAAEFGGWRRSTRTAVLREITGRRQQEQRLRRMANNDSLTGLWNRRRFLEHLDTRVALHQDDPGRLLALYFIDLDSFKTINDELGHAAGDHCLRVISQRLLAVASSDQLPGARDGTVEILGFRLAGDEFALIAEGIADRDEAERLAQVLLETGRDPIQYSDRTFSTSLSVGITVCPEHGTDTETLMKRADAAMYEAKHRGRDRYEFYDASFDRGEMGSVGPAEFIPIAERSGLISDLGAWCLRETCRQLRIWSDQGFDVVPISVNVSSIQFSQGDLRKVATEALREFAVDPNFIELELTESSILEENDETLLCLRDLRAIGLRVSLDDFGSGYSALTYLGRFPLDVLKLDYGFVRDIEHNDAAAGIVKAVISMAHTLGLRAVAEGVEDVEQAGLLTEMGCDELQGFLFSPAVPREKAETLLARDGEEPKSLTLQAPLIGIDPHGAVATVAPVSRVVSSEPEAVAPELDLRVLLVDDAQQSLGMMALRLIRLGFDLHYATTVEEADHFVSEERDTLQLVLTAPGGDLEGVGMLRSRLSNARQCSVPLIVMGERPGEDRRAAIRDAGATWVMWAPFEDGEMSFLLHAAIESSDLPGHRAEQRVPVNENVWLRVGQVRHVGVLTTLSIGGCFIETAAAPEPGTWMRLDFELPGCPIRVFGEVVYRRATGGVSGELCDGVGVQFSDLDKPSETAIHKLVETIAARYAP
jgi:diguanylate cyclase (GGDEF)-like protein